MLYVTFSYYLFSIAPFYAKLIFTAAQHIKLDPCHCTKLLGIYKAMLTYIALRKLK